MMNYDSLRQPEPFILDKNLSVGQPTFNRNNCTELLNTPICKTNDSRKINEISNECKKSQNKDDLVCDICEEEFSQWTQLKKHLVDHINDIRVQKTDSSSSSSKVNKKSLVKGKSEASQLQTENTSIKSSVPKRGRPPNSKNQQKNPSVKPENNSEIKSKSLSQRPLRNRGKPPRYQQEETAQNNRQVINSVKDEDDSKTIPNPHVNSIVNNPPPEIVDNSMSLDKDFSKPEETESSISDNSERKLSPVQCRVCKAMFYDRNELRKHQQQQHNNNRPYECVTCNRYFTTKNNLEVHMKYKHKQGPNPCECNICSKVLSSRANLRIHMRIHKGDRPFQCSLCQKRFSRKANMEMHLVYHTGERKFTCEICGQSFFAINALKRHTKLHTGERDYTCDVCGAAYVTGTDLRRHRLKHEDVKPFPCHLCPKQFTRAHDLKVHIRYHNKDLRFSCDVCERQFVEAGNYKRHLRKHTGERPYNCSICYVTFSQVTMI